MTGRYNAVLFDLDGTLTDPFHGIANSIKYALNKFGVHADDEQTLRACIGPPLLASFQKHFNLNERDARKAVAYYREYFSDKGLYENEVFPGIPRLLEELAAQRVCMVCATSKPTPYARRILEHFRLSQFLEFVIGSNMDLTRTDKKQIVHDVLEKLQMRAKEKAIMIGDRREDVEGARANSIDAIGVTYGYGSEAEIRNAHADYLVRSVEELGSLLKVLLASGKTI
ncbi:MAG: HAD family hydrolase [candidate division WOR-3 bacterium]|nr:MAG: HAD family hydrolase [candidate division WOR-3 bacterium]